MVTMDAYEKFLIECDTLKKIERRAVLTDNSRQENTAEHSWHIAVFALTLADYAPHNTDINRVIAMLVVHDIVEIDAGDVLLFERTGDVLKKIQERERKAADRLFGLLPTKKQAYLRQLWEEFEQAETNEARFAKVIDLLQPLLQLYGSGGAEWKKNKITAVKIRSSWETVKDVSPVIWDYVQRTIEKTVERGYIEET